VQLPVLQILGGDSRAAFRTATEALNARLAHARVVVIDGAKHAAHHTHAARFVSEVEAFLRP
jgi:pimeloyl-ACP methyl ester carboxylesterase